MRHIDWFGLVTIVATIYVQSSPGVAAGVQTASPRMQSDASFIAENPPKEFDFKNPTFWADQCRSLSSEKLYPEALESCEKAITLNPEKDPKKQQQQTLELWKLRSAALFNLGRYQEAIGSYDYVLGIQPAYSLGLTKRCDALAHLGRYDAAIASCDQALRLDGDWGDSSPAIAAAIRGTTLRKTGKLEAAIASYEQALVANPENVSLVAERCDTIVALKPVRADALAQFISKNGTSADTPILKDLKDALDHTEEEEKTCAQALETIDKKQDAAPVPAQALYKRGLVFKSQKRFLDAQTSFKAAVSTYERDLATNPNDPLVWTNQGMALEQLYQDARALTAYEKAVQLRPTESLALVNQCAVLNRLKRFQAALTACDSALKGNGLWENSSSAYAWSQRSNALLGVKQYEDAVASAERAITLTPSDAEAYNYKAVGLWFLKNYAEAKTAAQTAIELNDLYPQAFATLGRILSSQGQSEEAIKSYKQARQVYKEIVQQEFKPANPALEADLLTNLASALWGENQPIEALSFAEQAADLNSQSFEIQLNLGIIAIAAGNYGVALDAFQKANQLSPNNLYVLTGQGRALQGLADTDSRAVQKMEKYKQAIATLRIALSINSNYEPALQAYREVNERMKQQLLQKPPQKVNQPK